MRPPQCKRFFLRSIIANNRRSCNETAPQDEQSLISRRANCGTILALRSALERRRREEHGRRYYEYRDRRLPPRAHAATPDDLCRAREAGVRPRPPADWPSAG